MVSLAMTGILYDRAMLQLEGACILIVTEFHPNERRFSFPKRETHPKPSRRAFQLYFSTRIVAFDAFLRAVVQNAICSPSQRVRVRDLQSLFQTKMEFKIHANWDVYGSTLLGLSRSFCSGSSST